MSILIRHLFSQLGGLATQERRPRTLACDQTHGDPDASESNQEAVSHSDRLSPEKLWQVEHKPQSERRAFAPFPFEWDLCNSSVHKVYFGKMVSFPYQVA